MLNEKEAALALLLGRDAARSLKQQFQDPAEAFTRAPAGLDDKTLAKIAAIRTLGLAMTEVRVKERCALSSWKAVVDYLTTRTAHLGREQFRVLFLDRKNKLIADEVMGAGTVDHCPVYPREVARRALELNASSVILSHNHPSGDPTPSTSDVEMTKQVVDALRALDIATHDHVIVGAHGTSSLKQLGLM